MAMTYIYVQTNEDPCLFVVHGDTQCHIHFPDSNRFGGDRSSQVSITGQAASVEIARKRIRVGQINNYANGR